MKQPILSLWVGGGGGAARPGTIAARRGRAKKNTPGDISGGAHVMKKEA